MAELGVLIERVNGAGISVTLAVAGAPSSDVAATLGPTMYAIVQEALTNVIRHSGARTAQVSIEWAPQHAVATVSDDGVGGASAPPGHGTIGMRERAQSHAGELIVYDANGGGLVVKAVLPIGGMP